MGKYFSLKSNTTNSNNNSKPFNTAGVKKVNLASAYIYENALKLRFTQDDKAVTLDLNLPDLLKNNLLKGFFNTAAEGSDYAEYNMPFTVDYTTKDGRTGTKGIAFGIQNFVKKQEWIDGKPSDVKNADGKVMSDKETSLESYKRIIKNYKAVLEQVVEAFIDDEVTGRVIATNPAFVAFLKEYDDLVKTGDKTNEDSPYYILNSLCKEYDIYDKAKDRENKDAYKKEIVDFLLARFNTSELLNYLKEVFEQKVGKEVRLLLTFNHYMDKKVTPNVMKSNIIVPVSTLINMSPRSQVYGDYKNPITHEVEGVTYTFFNNYGMQRLFPIIENAETLTSEMPLYTEGSLFTKCFLTDYGFKEEVYEEEAVATDTINDETPF